MEIRGKPSWSLGITTLLTVMLVSLGHAEGSVRSAVATPIPPDDAPRATAILDSDSYPPILLVVNNGKSVALIPTSLTTTPPHNCIIKKLGREVIG